MPTSSAARRGPGKPAAAATTTTQELAPTFVVTVDGSVVFEGSSYRRREIERRIEAVRWERMPGPSSSG